jgi:hypothetical protein
VWGWTRAWLPRWHANLDVVRTFDVCALPFHREPRTLRTVTPSLAFVILCSIVCMSGLIALAIMVRGGAVIGRLKIWRFLDFEVRVRETPIPPRRIFRSGDRR